MFGLLFGTACLLGLVALMRGAHPHRHAHAWAHGHRGRRWRGHAGCGHDDASSDDDAPTWERRSGRGARRAFFRELGLEDDQIEAVTSAMDDIRAAGRVFADDLKASRADVAAAFRAETLDRARIDAMFEVQDQSIAALRRELVAALAKAHVALTPEQRRKAAEWLSSRGTAWL